MQISFLSSVEHIYLGKMGGGWEKGWNKRDPPGIQKLCDSQQLLPWTHATVPPLAQGKAQQ